MSLPPFTTRVKTNIDNVLQMTQMINGIMMTGDSRANQIIVEMYNSSGKLPIVPGTDTKIVGYFIRSDGYTVEVDGTINQNGEAVVIIPQSAYLITGALSIAIRLLDDKHIEIVAGEEIITYNTKIVIAALSCFVQNTETDAIIDPDHHIPDVQELLAYIDRLDEQYQAVAEAEADRVTAENARVTAENARVIAENARESESVRIIGEIDNMTVGSNTLSYTADPTVTITEVDGHKHIQFGMVPGKPFQIKKTFASVAEMEAYSGTDVEVGDMVIIASTVETPDNAKLYVKTATGWVFIVDMSGATGIQGPKGDTGDTGDTGPIGPRGYGIADITFNQNGTANLILEDGTVIVTPPIKGEPGVGSFAVSYDSVDDEIEIQIISAGGGN